ncbi:serine/threonine-protein kinase STY8 [Pelomyxa schiedti]|nr:serine/threonine-protein kinase STY8 [Pelomyxa schiedti]
MLLRRTGHEPLLPVLHCSSWSSFRFSFVVYVSVLMLTSARVCRGDCSLQSCDDGMLDVVVAGDFADSPLAVVTCGAVDERFSPSFVPMTIDGQETSSHSSTSSANHQQQEDVLSPVADAAYGPLTFTWTVAKDRDCDDCNYTYSAYVAIGADRGTGDSVASVNGLQGFGPAPVAGRQPAGHFELAFNCTDEFVAYAKFTFAVTSLCGNGSAPVTELVTFNVAVQCHTPGCSKWCSLHGECDYLRGVCICNDGWVGDSCGIMMTIPDHICPNEPLLLEWYIPKDVYNYQNIVNTMWFGIGGVNSPCWTEQRYFITSNSTPAAESDPRLNQDCTGSAYTVGYYPPGDDMTMQVCSDNAPDIFVSATIPVWSWEDCGFLSICDDGITSSTCNTDLGNGICIDGSCVCSDAYFWYDCSRGCASYTEVLDPSGTISSDSPAFEQDPYSMHYLFGHSCLWEISPSGSFDVIEFTLVFWNVERGDCINFYLYDSSGVQLDVPETTIYGGTKVGTISFTAKKVAVELLSSISNEGNGFILQYNTNRTPFPKFGSALIAVTGFAFLIAVLSLASVFFLWLYRKHKEKSRAAMEVPAAILPSSVDSELQSILSSLSQEGAEDDMERLLGNAGIHLSKTKLDFGLGSSDVFPVNEEQVDDMVLVNRGRHPVDYCFFVPDKPCICLSIKPGKGRIPPHKSTIVHFEVKLLYTTYFEGVIRLQVEGNSEAVHVHFPIKLQGAVSDRLDPDEIMLEPLPLAAGGFGCVFKGAYRSQLIAVKVVKQQEAMREKERQDFEDECALLKQLRHPYIVTYIGASFVTGKLCICTEFIEGGSVEKYLMSDVDIPYLLILKFAINVAEAMAFLHNNRILYRDLKCSNMLVITTSLTAEINCKLTDFGTARNVENPATIARYTVGLGTPVFMAPELLAAGPYNFKVDVYSFGVVLWQMWCRDEPWAGERVWDIPMIVIRGDKLPISEDCPSELSTLMNQCWEADAEKRPDFQALVGELSEVITQVSGDEGTPSTEGFTARASGATWTGPVSKKKTNSRRDTATAMDSTPADVSQFRHGEVKKKGNTLAKGTKL